MNYQTCAGFKIFEAENRIAKKNRLLGKFCFAIDTCKERMTQPKIDNGSESLLNFSLI